MTDFLIEPIGNGDNDLVMTNNDFVMVGNTEETHAQAVAQRVRYEVGTWFGESAFDRSKGFPWREAVFGTEPVDGIGALVHDRLVKVKGVDGIEQAPELTLDTEIGRLSIAVVVQAAGFEVPVSTEVQS